MSCGVFSGSGFAIQRGLPNVRKSDSFSLSSFYCRANLFLGPVAVSIVNPKRELQSVISAQTVY
jgi:hypothetical protein